MKIQANGLQIEVDVQGPPNGEAVLLIMGLGMQLVGWPDELVADLVRRGFQVIRFDNRDIGLSEGFDQSGVPNLLTASMRFALRMPVAAPYQLRDLAHDALGVLDALHIRQAHVCGASMGGMVAQHLAAAHPTRVKSLTLVMTTSGARHLPQPSWRVRQALMARPRSKEVPDVVAHMESLLSIIGSPAYRPEPQRLRERIEASVRRAYRPKGMLRQLVAIAADGDRSAWLQQLRVPTAVVHGADDALVPPAAGRQLAELIPGASLNLVPGMGHDLPTPLLPMLADEIAQVAARAATL